MGNHVTRNDFEWTDQEEPHAKRRKEILRKYPEIKKLFGVDPSFKWKVFGMVLTQFFMLYLLQHCSWYIILPVAYCFGGVINHSLMLAIHEIAHSAAFGVSYPLSNKLLGIFANLPIGIPFAVAFKGYHLEHHRFQGIDKVDSDIPSLFEAMMFCTTFGKFIWMLFQPLFYAVRPLIMNPRSPQLLELINTFIQVAFDAVVIYIFGLKMLLYLVIGSLLAMGIHPVAGHFISEHYMFHKGFETYSYYGCLNLITFNVGYHNEHHDFPYIPGRFLPEVRKIAPEFYDHLPHHKSWCRVLFDYIMDPAIGPYARIKRLNALEKKKIR